MKKWSVVLRSEDEDGNSMVVTLRGIHASTSQEAGRIAKFLMHEPGCWKVNSVTEKVEKVK